MKAITYFFLEPRFGGAHLRACESATPLLELSIQTKVTLPKTCDENSTMQRICAINSSILVDYLRIPALAGLTTWTQILLYVWRAALASIRLVRYFYKHSGEVYLFHGMATAPYLFMARVCGVKAIWFVNDTFPPRRVAKVIGRITQALASDVICQGLAVSDFYGLKRVGERNLMYPPSRTPGSCEVRTKNYSRIFTIGLIANISPVKDIELFLESMNILLNSDRYKIRAKIFGAVFETQTEYKRKLDRMISTMPRGESIEFSGPFEKPEDVFQNIDLLVISSKSEGCPPVLSEAFAFGVPVVSVPVGSIPEIFTLNGNELLPGILVAERTPTEIASACAALITDDEKYNNASLAARAIYSGNLTLDKYCQRLARFAREVA